MTGCTYGKGNLIHRDYGKNAFTFYRRSDDRAVRLASRPQAWGPADQDRDARSEAILDAPLEHLFTIEPVVGPIPRKARIHTSLTCEHCGEQTMETRARHFGGQTLCLPCFERLELRV
ncbi:MAG: hypothetical protein NVSMB2_25160 [Chloroflexota bacterium]